MYAVYSTVDSASTDGSDLSPKVQGVQLQRSRPSLPLTTNCLLPSDGLIITAVAQCGLMLHLVRSSQCSRVVVGASAQTRRIFLLLLITIKHSLQLRSAIAKTMANWLDWWQTAGLSFFRDVLRSIAPVLPNCKTNQAVFLRSLGAIYQLPTDYANDANWLNFINYRVPACLRVESATRTNTSSKLLLAAYQCASWFNWLAISGAIYRRAKCNGTVVVVCCCRTAFIHWRLTRARSSATLVLGHCVYN